MSDQPKESGQPCPKCGKTWINGDCSITPSRRGLCARTAAANGHAGPRCLRCDMAVPFTINAAVSLTVHYEEHHADVRFPVLMAEVVEACGPSCEPVGVSDVP